MATSKDLCKLLVHRRSSLRPAHLPSLFDVVKVFDVVKARVNHAGERSLVRLGTGQLFLAGDIEYDGRVS